MDKLTVTKMVDYYRNNTYRFAKDFLHLNLYTYQIIFLVLMDNYTREHKVFNYLLFNAKRAYRYSNNIDYINIERLI